MRTPILLILLLFSLQSSGQCLDSLRIPDPYYPCGTTYDPVCGCDNITYRNECSAVNWGGLNFNAYQRETICGNFDFDIYPTALSFKNNVIYFTYYTKSTGFISAYVYDTYGKIHLQKDYNVSYIRQEPWETREIQLGALEMGIYHFVVIFNGEKQYRSFGVIKF
jgi:hypothetical protein